jgi:hypothetical protein
MIDEAGHCLGGDVEVESVDGNENTNPTVWRNAVI